MKVLFLGLMIFSTCVTSTFAQTGHSFEAMKIVQSQYEKGHLPSYDLLLNSNGFDCSLNADSTVHKNLLSFNETPLGVANIKKNFLTIRGKKINLHGGTFIDSGSAFIQQSSKHYVSVRANERDRLLVELGHVEVLEQKKEVMIIDGMEVTFESEDDGFTTKGTLNAVERPDYKALSYLTCTKAAKPARTSQSEPNYQDDNNRRSISKKYQCTYVGKNLRKYTETAVNRDIADHKARTMCRAFSDMCISKGCIEI